MIWIILLGIWVLIWSLFVRGYLWRTILFFAGWFGIRYLLLAYCPDSHQIALIFVDCHITWATVVASIICVMCLLTTKSD